MGKRWKHFMVVAKHRHQVIRNGFHMGIFWQCLFHDLSKYSHAEFALSAHYFQGDSSPVLAERKEHGYFSFICQHHTSKNKHHWEYWTDFFKGKIICCTMPWKYATEFVCDTLSASKTYNPKEFSGQTCLDYFQKRKKYCFMTKMTETYIEWCLKEYAENGWKNLKRRNTKAYYESLKEHYPRFEVVEKLLEENPLSFGEEGQSVI